MLCYRCVSKSIKTASNALDHTPHAQATDRCPGNFILFKIARADYALPAEEINKFLLCCEIHGNRLLFQYVNIYQYTSPFCNTQEVGQLLRVQFKDIGNLLLHIFRVNFCP